MINVLFVFGGEFHRGGTETVMLNIFKYIDHRKYHIDFLLLGPKGYGTEGYELIESFHGSIYCVTPRKESWIRQLKDIKQIFKEKHFDIIHTHADSLASDCLRIAAKNKIGVRIAHSHNTSQATKYKGIKGRLHQLLMQIERYSVRFYATHYMACSREAGIWLFGKSIAKSPKFMVFKNAIEADRFRKNKDIIRKVKSDLGIREQLVIGHVGRFDYQKNHLFLINIFECVHQRNPQTVLVLAGEGELLEDIKKLVKMKKLDESVIFLGSRDDVDKVMQIFDVFVFPSRYEGLGIVLIEAQAAGIKCFASSVIPKEVNICGNVEFLDLTLKAKVWSDRILDYLSMHLSADYEKMGDALYSIISAGYDMQTNIKELEKFYEKCLTEI